MGIATGPEQRARHVHGAVGDGAVPLATVVVPVDHLLRDLQRGDRRTIDVCGVRFAPPLPVARAGPAVEQQDFAGVPVRTLVDADHPLTSTMATVEGGAHGRPYAPSPGLISPAA